MANKYSSPRKIKLGWYSIKPGIEVYHNNHDCTKGNNIEIENKRKGTGNYRLCKHCERLNRRKK